MLEDNTIISGTLQEPFYQKGIFDGIRAPRVNNIAYLDAFCKPEYFPEFLPEYANLDELKAHYTKGGLGDVKVKRFLNKVMQAELEPIRARRHEWDQHLDDVMDILKDGTAKANAKANETLHSVKKAMRINYFEDGNLLK